MNIHIAGVISSVTALGIAYAKGDVVAIVIFIVATIVALVGVVGRMEKR